MPSHSDICVGNVAHGNFEVRASQTLRELVEVGDFEFLVIPDVALHLASFSFDTLSILMLVSLDIIIESIIICLALPARLAIVANCFIGLSAYSTVSRVASCDLYAGSAFLSVMSLYHVI